MATRKSKKRVLGVVAGTCLVAVAPFVSGCTDDKNDGSGKTEPPRRTTGKSSKQEDGSPKPSLRPEPGKGKGKSPQASSAQDAVTRWVTAIVENRPGQACEVMAVSPGGTSDAESKTVGKCGSTPAEAQATKKRLSKFHTAFTPEQPQKPPQVQVGGAPPSGSPVKVDGEQITVDGQTLNAVVLSNSEGLDKGQVDVKLEASRIGKSWYVTDLDLSVG